MLVFCEGQAVDCRRRQSRVGRERSYLELKMGLVVEEDEKCSGTGLCGL